MLQGETWYCWLPGDKILLSLSVRTLNEKDNSKKIELFFPIFFFFFLYVHDGITKTKYMLVCKQNV